MLVHVWPLNRRSLNQEHKYCCQQLATTSLRADYLLGLKQPDSQRSSNSVHKSRHCEPCSVDFFPEKSIPKNGQCNRPDPTPLTFTGALVLFCRSYYSCFLCCAPCEPPSLSFSFFFFLFFSLFFFLFFFLLFFFILFCFLLLLSSYFCCSSHLFSSSSSFSSSSLSACLWLLEQRQMYHHPAHPSRKWMFRKSCCLQTSQTCKCCSPKGKRGLISKRIF